MHSLIKLNNLMKMFYRAKKKQLFIGEFMDKILRAKDLYTNAFEKIKQEYNDETISLQETVKYLTSLLHTVTYVADNLKNEVSINIIAQFDDLAFEIEEFINNLKKYQFETYENVDEYAIKRLSETLYIHIEEENEKGIEND